MKAYISGLPMEAKNLIEEAVAEGYDGLAEVEELNKSELVPLVKAGLESPEVCLMILDASSEKACSVLGDLKVLGGEKYHSYGTDEDLVLWLNEYLGTELVVPEKLEVNVSEEIVGENLVSSAPDFSLWEERLASKDSLISQLKAQISEMREVVESCSTGNTGELEDAKAEILDLKSQILELKKTQGTISNDAELVRKIEELKLDNSALKSSKDSLKKEYESIKNELLDVKANRSQIASTIISKDKLIEELKGELAVAGVSASKLRELKTENARITIDLNHKAEQLKVKDSEILGYLKELDSMRKNTVGQDKIKQYQERAEEWKEKFTILDSEVTGIKTELSGSKEMVAELETKLNSVEAKKLSLENDVARLSDDLGKANSINLQLQSEMDSIKAEFGGQENLGEVSKELAGLKHELGRLRESPFVKIGEKAFVKSSVGGVLDFGKKRYENVSFVFSGCGAYSKDTYGFIKNMASLSGRSNPVVIVDLYSDSSIDYVMGIEKFRNAETWFESGGSFDSYLTPTKYRGVSVLSFGSGYVNDAYLMSIDWKRRLAELESSGYKVVIFGGCLDSLVSRAIFESGYGLFEKTVFTSGLAVHLRGTMRSLKGLKGGAKDCEVLITSKVPQLEGLYRMAERQINCRFI